MESPYFILIRPQMGENIGAAARALANFQAGSLRLVHPRDGWPNQRAVDMAVGAFDHLPPVQVFDTLQEAIADLQTVYATTARDRAMTKPVYTPEAAVQAMTSAPSAGAGIVFGPERTGLENDEIALCHNIITAPLNPDFSSVNLGQSVLMIAYEWHRQTSTAPALNIPMGKSDLVTQEKMEEFHTRLFSKLAHNNFFRDDGLRPTMERNIRSLFMRAQPTDQEVRTLHGVVSALIGNKTPKP